jgi:hypothetical protein
MGDSNRGTCNSGSHAGAPDTPSREREIVVGETLLIRLRLGQRAVNAFSASLRPLGGMCRIESSAVHRIAHRILELVLSIAEQKANRAPEITRTLSI